MPKAFVRFRHNNTELMKEKQRRHWNRPGRATVWWDFFVDKVVLPEHLFHILVHGPGPQKLTFRYHSGGVMLSYIFENCNYSSFILCMIAMLNE